MPFRSATTTTSTSTSGRTTASTTSMYESIPLASLLTRKLVCRVACVGRAPSPISTRFRTPKAACRREVPVPLLVVNSPDSLTMRACCSGFSARQHHGGPQAVAQDLSGASQVSHCLQFDRVLLVQRHPFGCLTSLSVSCSWLHPLRTFWRLISFFALAFHLLCCVAFLNFQYAAPPLQASSLCNRLETR